ncbi:MAG: 2-amino-4-hydroxy-6-hydroxymethyldihydropteridine diphosphokinase [Desulfobacterales bacterium]|nr:2-amino-4-hydroxy-6-hydroxymethyldihydropteridine diphosphokinase [Desulfobacterales bacterium]
MTVTPHFTGQPVVAYLCAGSNIGDKPANCRKGIDALVNTAKTRLAALSRFYRTEPVDYADQDWFVNVVAKVVTTETPLALLERLKTIEVETGRQAGGIRFGPRVLDLDILFYGDRVIDTAELVVPHPRMHKRHFVLKPFCDIDPAIVHPTLQRTVQALLGDLDTTGQAVSVFSCDF